MTIQRSVKREYPALVKSQVGRWLNGAPRGSQKIVAQALDVSERTLRSWKRSFGSTKRRGRRQQQSSLWEQRRIVQEWVRQGYPGSRPVIKALPGVRVRLVRAVIAELKLRRRRRAMEKKIKVRTRITVKAVGVVVAMDGATIQKGEDLLVVRDRGSLSVKAEACEGSLRSLNTLETLQKMKDEARLPLVLCTDNGSPFCSSSVRSFLEDNKIIHLRSLPRVPQHNGSCENAVRELKLVMREGVPVAYACTTLNESRKRRQLGWKTSLEIDRENFVPYNEENRKMFYEGVKLAINEAVLGTKSVRERRKIEREVILAMLERFRLVIITRGDQTYALKSVENACTPQ
jgi:transposase InsO family protein